MNDEYLTSVYKFATSNKQSVYSSELCGCFQCKNVFQANEIYEFVKDKNGDTACCPICSIDSVLCDNDVVITKDLLEEMNKKYFKSRG